MAGNGLPRSQIRRPILVLGLPRSQDFTYQFWWLATCDNLLSRLDHTEELRLETTAVTSQALARHDSTCSFWVVGILFNPLLWHLLPLNRFHSAPIFLSSEDLRQMSMSLRSICIRSQASFLIPPVLLISPTLLLIPTFDVVCILLVLQSLFR